MKFVAISSSVLALLLVHSAFAQSLPSKIHGYKLYETNVVVINADDASADKKNADVAVRFFKPKVTGMGASGVTLEVSAEMTALSRSGSVDLMMFRDFGINGIDIEIEEYNTPFEFKKGETIKFAKPARITISAASVAKGSYKELMGSKDDWSVTGTILVFGKFKKFGIGLKRVVPVRIDLGLKSLLR